MKNGLFLRWYDNFLRLDTQRAQRIERRIRGPPPGSAMGMDPLKLRDMDTIDG